MAIVTGPVRRGVGIAPAVALVDPKFPHNVGAAVRAASCYGIRQVWFTGDRVQLVGARGYRLPREERMRGYKEVELRHCTAVGDGQHGAAVGDGQHGAAFFEAFDRDVVPVAVEVRPGSESLIDFEHPERALYVFGAEDGTLGKAVLRHCHRFVVIPTRHCTNLSAAVYTMLYDRHAKRVRAGLEEPHRLAESRERGATVESFGEAPGAALGESFVESESMMDAVGVTWGRAT
jgi:tRNA(Leu) C34 or U34 (ribose-2'-O)-methylase TrmL